MKHFFLSLLAICMLMLCGCQLLLTDVPLQPQISTTEPIETFAVTEPVSVPAEETTQPAEVETTAETAVPALPTEEATVAPAFVAGWFEEDGKRYYRLEDGSLARGTVTIDGMTHHFTSTGAYVIVVNPWNTVPEGYAPQLQELSTAVSVSGAYVDASCYDAMTQMILDCNALSGANVCVVSAYRSVELQTENFNNKVNKYMDAGYDYDAAYAEAASVIAVPGTSEHHLGLAADIIDTEIWDLVQAQENLPGQRWLMENCWKYGFILRYPADSRDVTGIIYEPWHYRYVGIELATELYESGLTLEEYMTNLT